MRTLSPPNARPDDKHHELHRSRCRARAVLGWRLRSICRISFSSVLAVDRKPCEVISSRTVTKRAQGGIHGYFLDIGRLGVRRPGETQLVSTSGKSARPSVRIATAWLSEARRARVSFSCGGAGIRHTAASRLIFGPFGSMQFAGTDKNMRCQSQGSKSLPAGHQSHLWRATTPPPPSPQWRHDF